MCSIVNQLLKERIWETWTAVLRSALNPLLLPYYLLGCCDWVPWLTCSQFHQALPKHEPDRQRWRGQQRRDGDLWEMSSSLLYLNLIWTFTEGADVKISTDHKKRSCFFNCERGNGKIWKKVLPLIPRGQRGELNRCSVLMSNHEWQCKQLTNMLRFFSRNQCVCPALWWSAALVFIC